jgi:hypothetical protein
LEQVSYGGHKVIGKDIHAKEFRHSRILFRWKCGIPWRIMEESGIRISSFSKDLHQNVIPDFEGLFGKEFKPIKTPMSEGYKYHPEIDDSPLCTEDDSAKYRSIIGCCIWIIVLGRFDITYATSAMSRFDMLPREGNLKAVKRILSYLKTFLKVRVIIDTAYPDHSMYPANPDFTPHTILQAHVRIS